MKEIFENYLGKRKADIIAAVLELADRHGIRGITTKKIAEEVGFGEGALYKHIHSKTEAFAIILDLFEDLLNKQFRVLASSKLPADAALRELFRYSLQFLEKYPGIFRILFSDELYIESKENFSKFKDIIVFTIKMVGDIIEKGAEGGIFRADTKADMVSLRYVGLIHTAFTYWNVVEERHKGLTDIAMPIFDDFMESLTAKEK